MSKHAQTERWGVWPTIVFMVCISVVSALQGAEAQEVQKGRVTLIDRARISDVVDFLEFNDFLDAANAALVGESLEGEIQIASFHPDYRFEATEPNAIGNYTNRSPYPMLHLIREESVSRAIAGHPDPESIPDRNIARLESLGEQALRKLLAR